MANPIATSTIAAQAFRLMELGPISSFADETPQARDAAEQFPVARRMCLEHGDWSFASQLADLPEVALPDHMQPTARLPHLYRLPADCLIVREVVGCTDWRLDRDYLRASTAGPLSIRYTADQENESRLPAKFQQALAYRLAAMLSPRWVGAANKAEMLEQAAAQFLAQAMQADTRHASSVRYDGRPEQGDWVCEALR